MGLTTNRNDPELGHGYDDEKIDQHKKYLVLSEEEIKKGFVRPVRDSYIHVGKKVELEGGTLRELTEEEKERYKDENYGAFIEYPKNSESSVIGKFISKEESQNIGKFIGGCNGLTKMNQTIAETYARDPKFYGSTYCVHCRMHRPVEEFHWDGTTEKVGS